jgi:hypothetical protein
MIDYAVVGAGWISQIAFLPGVAQSGNSRVAAIVTGDRTKAAQLAEFHGVDTIVGYDGYDALRASSKIDAVYIALPNDMHADFTIRAARAGRHVMVEKPLAVNEDESLAIIAAARKANVFLMVAYRLHNEPGTVAVLEHIRAGAIGRPLYFQSAFSFQMASVNHRLKAKAWGDRFKTSACIASTPPDTFSRRSRSRPWRWRNDRRTTRASAKWTRPCPGCCFGLVKFGRLAVEPDLAFLDSAQAVDGLAELCAPGTNDTGKSDDLALVHGERNVSQKFTRPERLDLQYGAIHPRMSRRGSSRMPSCIHDQRAFVPEHPANDGIDVGPADFGRADAGAVAQNRHAVGKIENLPQSVRDIEYRDAGLPQPAHDSE